MNFNRRRLCFRKKIMSFGGRHVFKIEIKILAVCHAWNFFALFYYPAVFVACRPKCKIDHLIHCHCGGSICETKKNCMSDFFFHIVHPLQLKGGHQSVSMSPYVKFVSYMVHLWNFISLIFKGQIKSEWIYEVIDFPNYQLKNLNDFWPWKFWSWISLDIGWFDQIFCIFKLGLSCVLVISTY